MAFLMSPWAEELVQWAPILYALGFFAVEVPLAWGFAGFVTGMFLGTIAYQVGSQPYLILSGGMITVSLIGSALSYGGELRKLKWWNSGGIAATSRSEAPAQGQPGAPSHPKNFVIVGRVYDSRDISAAISGAKVSVVGWSGYEKTTDSAGKYRLEVPDTAWLKRDKISIEADHPNFHYKKHSKYEKVYGGEQIEINFPLDRLVGPRAALGDLKITFADATNPSLAASNIVRPGGMWAAHIEAFAPLTFDIPSHRPVSQRDSFLLIDENVNPGKRIMTVDASTPRSKGEIRYGSPTHIFISGRVPSTYEEDSAPLPTSRDIKVMLVANVNVT